MQPIGFIGGGNMATAIIAGLTQSGIPGEHIWVLDLHTTKLQQLAQNYNVNTTQDYTELCQQAEIIILATKPQVITEVLIAIKPEIKPSHLFYSILAGTSTKTIAKLLGTNPAVIRCMPNTPALIQQGISGLYANEYVNESQKQVATLLTQAFGKYIWFFDETDLDAVTAISGSGPAYFFWMLESISEFVQVEPQQLLTDLLQITKSMHQAKLQLDLTQLCLAEFLWIQLMDGLSYAAASIGLDEEAQTQLITQTALGSCLLAQQQGLSFKTLRESVTSKGGTTAAALAVIEDAELAQLLRQFCVDYTNSRQLSQLQSFPKLEFERILAQAVEAAWVRARELS